MSAKRREKRITDKERLDFVLKIGFLITTVKTVNPAWCEEKEIDRRSDIDAAIRAERTRTKGGK